MNIIEYYKIVIKNYYYNDKNIIKLLNLYYSLKNKFILHV